MYNRSSKTIGTWYSTFIYWTTLNSWCAIKYHKIEEMSYKNLMWCLYLADNRQLCKKHFHCRSLLWLNWFLDSTSIPKINYRTLLTDYLKDKYWLYFVLKYFLIPHRPNQSTLPLFQAHGNYKPITFDSYYNIIV